MATATRAATPRSDDVKLDILAAPRDPPKASPPCCRTKGWFGYELCGRCFCGWEDHCVLVVEGTGTVATVLAFVAEQWLLAGITGGATIVLCSVHGCMRRYRSIANLKEVSVQVKDTNKEMQGTQKKADDLAKTYLERAEKAEGLLKKVDQERAQWAQDKISSDQQIAKVNQERAQWAQERQESQKQVDDLKSQNSNLSASLKSTKEENAKLSVNITKMAELLAQSKGFLASFNQQNGSFVELIQRVDQRSAAIALLDKKLDTNIAKVGEDLNKEEEEINQAIEQAKSLRDQIARLLSAQIEALSTKTHEFVQISDKLESKERELAKAVADLEDQRKREAQSLDDLKDTFLKDDRIKEETLRKQKEELITLRQEIHQLLQQVKQSHTTSPSTHSPAAGSSHSAAADSSHSSIDDLLKQQASTNERLQKLLERAKS